MMSMFSRPTDREYARRMVDDVTDRKKKDTIPSRGIRSTKVLMLTKHVPRKGVYPIVTNMFQGRKRVPTVTNIYQGRKRMPYQLP